MSLKPFRLENWHTEDLDYLGGPFAKGHLSREVAAKEWNAVSAAFGGAATTPDSGHGLNLPSWRARPNRPKSGSEKSWARWSAEENEFREQGAAAYAKADYSFNDDSDYARPPKPRRELHPGKSTGAPVEFPPEGTWHIGGVTEWFATKLHREYSLEAQRLTGIPTNTPPVKWSMRQVRCSICFDQLPLEGNRRRYCSDACYAKRRRKRQPEMRFGYVPPADLHALDVEVRSIARNRKPLPHCYLSPTEPMPIAV